MEEMLGIEGVDAATLLDAEDTPAPDASDGQILSPVYR